MAVEATHPKEFLQAPTISFDIVRPFLHRTKAQPSRPHEHARSPQTALLLVRPLSTLYIREVILPPRLPNLVSLYGDHLCSSLAPGTRQAFQTSHQLPDRLPTHPSRLTAC